MTTKNHRPTRTAQRQTATPWLPPQLNTWWVRHCNQQRYFLRQIHQFLGQPYVWIHLEGRNRCYHLPLITLLKNYSQLEVGPVDPATGHALAPTQFRHN